jgi:membrane protease YdiL (CAAX protease family)
MKNTSIGQLILCIVIPFLGMLAFGGIAVALLVQYLAPTSLTNIEGALLLLSKNTVFFLNMIPFFIGFGLILFSVKFFIKSNLTSIITSRNQIDWRRFFVSFSVWSVISLLFFCIDYFTNPEAFLFQFDGATFGVLMLVSLVAIPVQTGFEELIFRGFLLQLSQRFFTRIILLCLVNGLFFGAVHLSNPEIDLFGWPAILYYTITGVFLAAITLFDKGMELAWGFHAANNFFGVVFLTNNWQVLQTNALFTDTRGPEIGFELVWTLLVAYPVLFLFFAKCYRWDVKGVFSGKLQ